MTAHFKLVPFPKEFPHAGEFIVWSQSWNRIGYAANQQYPGQMPITFPEDAELIEIQAGGYLRPVFMCKFCGAETEHDPSDQSMPATTCDHEGEFS